MFLLISECPGTALQMQLARAWDPQQEFPRCQEQVPIPLAQPSHPLLEGAEPQAPPRRVDPQASKALYSSFLSVLFLSLLRVSGPCGSLALCSRMTRREAATE